MNIYICALGEKSVGWIPRSRNARAEVLHTEHLGGCCETSAVITFYPFRTLPIIYECVFFFFINSVLAMLDTGIVLIVANLIGINDE